jgi:hypothetical protein
MLGTARFVQRGGALRVALVSCLLGSAAMARAPDAAAEELAPDGRSYGSRIWCSIALEPYAWDEAHGVRVPLTPETFELIPEDERVQASPDGSGWIAHGESRMTIVFQYVVRDKATHATVLRNVAVLSCSDGPAVASASTPPALPPPPAPDLSWLTPPAPAVDLPSPAPAERKGVSADLRVLATGVILGTNTVQMQETGVQLGVGSYVSPHWYVGASARWALLLDMTGDNGLTNQFQLGPEARWVFHEGQGTLRVNGGPRRRIPRVDWLGLRAGVEEVLPGAPSGVFSEVAWGSEFRVGALDFGTVLAAGVGVDSASTYGDGSVIHPYLNFALRFGGSPG